MKTRLLKKIRKQYSIVYYPDGRVDSEIGVINKNQYVVHNFWLPSWTINYFNTLDEAKEFVLKRVRERYESYSRKYKKPNYKGIKVWYNGNRN